MTAKNKLRDNMMFILLTLLSAVFLAPIFIILMNSFKGRLYISDAPFDLPNRESFAGLENYLTGIDKTGFLNTFGNSLFITVASVAVIVVLTAMTGWYITRVKSKFSSLIYYLFLFSMIVPFQMVMYTMSKMASDLHLDSIYGLVVSYLGFGAGLPVFMYCGFVKSIPLEIEEAATIDGCNPIQIFFRVVLPILKPVSFTVAILNAMWIWNDYLLPFLVIGSNESYRTIPIAVQQYLQGGYGSRDTGAMMAMLILAIIPVIVFYVFCQKYIIRGVVAGAVKG
jgi:raffinose/stachyose/melibiose transport system permease protein